MGYFYIFGSIIFAVLGQITMKWRVGKYGELPLMLHEKIIFILKLLLDPFILLGFFSAFISSVFWIAAMTKFDISYAYPFMSLSFVLIFVLSIFLFHEPISMYKVAGLMLIVLGIIVTSKSV